MGYRCPNCHQDFGYEKEKLEEHLLENPKCNAEAFVHTELWKISVGIKKPKTRYGERGRVEQTHRKINNVSPKHVWEKVNLVTNEDGSDTVVCKKCGLEAKRFGSSFEFDMRFTHKIQYCND